MATRKTASAKTARVAAPAKTPAASAPKAPDAPVTIATLPVISNIACGLCMTRPCNRNLDNFRQVLDQPGCPCHDGAGVGNRRRRMGPRKKPK